MFHPLCDKCNHWHKVGPCPTPSDEQYAKDDSARLEWIQNNLDRYWLWCDLAANHPFWFERLNATSDRRENFASGKDLREAVDNAARIKATRNRIWCVSCEAWGDHDASECNAFKIPAGDNKTPIIKVGDILKLRNGAEVKILETDAPGTQPIVWRMVAPNHFGYVATGTNAADGACALNKTERPFDLILPKRRVPWNKLTDVELGHEYWCNGVVGPLSYVDTNYAGKFMRLGIGNQIFDMVPNFKHRAPGTSEWLECDKEEEDL